MIPHTTTNNHVDMNEKLINAVTTIIRNNKEPLQLFIKQKIGPISLEILKQEEIIRLIFGSIHSALPLPARLLFSEKKFTNFFATNKERAIQMLEPLLGEQENSRQNQCGKVDEET